MGTDKIADSEKLMSKKRNTFIHMTRLIPTFNVINYWIDFQIMNEGMKKENDRREQ